MGEQERNASVAQLLLLPVNGEEAPPGEVVVRRRGVLSLL